MSGVYIKGMKMPKNCFDCLLSTYGYCMASEHGNIIPADAPIPDWCPLIELPPHGRLIDADALMLKILDYIEEYDGLDENGYHDLKWCAMKEAQMSIDDAPTVIPADKDGES